jgi:uncharacterized membrane protein
MKWTEESLSALATKDGYRLRGDSMTRIEVFSDAAFAFAVTMLVISLSTIPHNFNELVAAIQKVPSFAASFTVMMLIWLTHRRWSQRFGMDDGVSTFLTLSLVFVVLIYVYPLKLIMDLMFYAFSQRLFPADYQVTNTTEVALLMAIFSFGFFLISLIQLGLYRRAANKEDELCLSPLEKLLIGKEVLIWSVQASLAFLVALAALIFMSSVGYLAGIAYGLTPIIIPLVTLKTKRKIQSSLPELSNS